MWFKRKLLKYLGVEAMSGSIVSLEKGQERAIDRLDNLDYKTNYEYCKTCNIMLTQSMAITGEPEIRRRPSWSYEVGAHDEDYIYYPKYCKVHAPGVENKTTDEIVAKQMYCEYEKCTTLICSLTAIKGKPNKDLTHCPRYCKKHALKEKAEE